MLDCLPGIPMRLELIPRRRVLRCRFCLNLSGDGACPSQSHEPMQHDFAATFGKSKPLAADEGVMYLTSVRRLYKVNNPTV